MYDRIKSFPFPRITPPLLWLEKSCQSLPAGRLKNPRAFTPGSLNKCDYFQFCHELLKIEVPGNAIGLAFCCNRNCNTSKFGSRDGNSSTNSYGKILFSREKAAVTPAAAPARSE